MNDERMGAWLHLHQAGLTDVSPKAKNLFSHPPNCPPLPSPPPPPSDYQSHNPLSLYLPPLIHSISTHPPLSHPVVLHCQASTRPLHIPTSTHLARAIPRRGDYRSVDVATRPVFAFAPGLITPPRPESVRWVSFFSPHFSCFLLREPSPFSNSSAPAFLHPLPPLNLPHHPHISWQSVHTHSPRLSNPLTSVRFFFRPGDCGGTRRLVALSLGSFPPTSPIPLSTSHPLLHLRRHPKHPDLRCIPNTSHLIS
jgi:hypothetical protein